MTTKTSHYTGEERSKRIFAIVGASSGNLVEWFDFYVYAFCAIYFAPAFFLGGVGARRGRGARGGGCGDRHGFALLYEIWAPPIVRRPARACCQRASRPTRVQGDRGRA